MMRSLLLGGAMLLASVEAGALAKAPPGVELPIKDVTVFSDRARIVRQGEIHVDSGSHLLALPRLPETADPESVRVEASGGRIARVEVRHAVREALPKTEAQQLVDKLTKLRDEAITLADHLDTLQNEERFLDSIRPHGDPIGADRQPPLLLNPTGWGVALDFFDTRSSAIEKGEAEYGEQLRGKQKEIATAEAQAAQLLGAGTDDSGFDVQALVEGRNNDVHLTLTYVARGARWYPAYDVRYTAGEKTVEVGFSGLVAQQTGENWSDARLTLSTAVPATVTDLPKLAIWKIGDRERFIPRPVAGPQEATFSAAKPMRKGTAAAEQNDQRLRQQLEFAAHQAGREALVKTDEAAKEAEGKPTDGEEDTRRTYAESTTAADEPSMPPPPPAAAPMPVMAAPPRATDFGGSGAARSATLSSQSFSTPSMPWKNVSFGAPRGWNPPALAGDLPAMLAGGYEFTYVSAEPESIRSGAEARRVPLFTQRFPAESWIKILPALSHSAYLVAEVTNTGSTPWLQGRAHLFVGADLVGDATVPTTAPGEKVTLPLGIDDAIRVDRNVQVVSTERGVFAKQDVSAYQTVIEMLNTHQTVMPVRVFDQISLPHQKEVEIALMKVDPPATKDDKTLKEEGNLEWRLDLPAGGQRSLSFTYEVARPKGWKLWQTSSPGVNQ